MDPRTGEILRLDEIKTLPPEEPWDYPEPEGADAHLTTAATEEQPAGT